MGELLRASQSSSDGSGEDADLVANTKSMSLLEVLRRSPFTPSASAGNAHSRPSTTPILRQQLDPRNMPSDDLPNGCESAPAPLDTLVGRLPQPSPAAAGPVSAAARAGRAPSSPSGHTRPSASDNHESSSDSESGSEDDHARPVFNLLRPRAAQPRPQPSCRAVGPEQASNVHPCPLSRPPHPPHVQTTTSTNRTPLKHINTFQARAVPMHAAGAAPAVARTQAVNPTGVAGVQAACATGQELSAEKHPKVPATCAMLLSARSAQATAGNKLPAGDADQGRGSGSPVRAPGESGASVGRPQAEQPPPRSRDYGSNSSSSSGTSSEDASDGEDAAAPRFNLLRRGTGGVAARTRTAPAVGTAPPATVLQTGPHIIRPGRVGSAARTGQDAPQRAVAAAVAAAAAAMIPVPQVRQMCSDGNREGDSQGTSGNDGLHEVDAAGLAAATATTAAAATLTPGAAASERLHGPLGGSMRDDVTADAAVTARPAGVEGPCDPPAGAPAGLTQVAAHPLAAPASARRIGSGRLRSAASRRAALSPAVAVTPAAVATAAAGAPATASGARAPGSSDEALAQAILTAHRRRRSAPAPLRSLFDDNPGGDGYERAPGVGNVAPPLSPPLSHLPDEADAAAGAGAGDQDAAVADPYGLCCDDHSDIDDQLMQADPLPTLRQRPVGRSPAPQPCNIEDAHDWDVVHTGAHEARTLDGECGPGEWRGPGHLASGGGQELQGRQHPPSMVQWPLPAGFQRPDKSPLGCVPRQQPPTEGHHAHRLPQPQQPWRPPPPPPQQQQQQETQQQSHHQTRLPQPSPMPQPHQQLQQQPTFQESPAAAPPPPMPLSQQAAPAVRLAPTAAAAAGAAGLAAKRRAGATAATRSQQQNAAAAAGTHNIMSLFRRAAAPVAQGPASAPASATTSPVNAGGEPPRKQSRLRLSAPDAGGATLAAAPAAAAARRPAVTIDLADDDGEGRGRGPAAAAAARVQPRRASAGAVPVVVVLDEEDDGAAAVRAPQALHGQIHDQARGLRRDLDGMGRGAAAGAVFEPEDADANEDDDEELGLYDAAGRQGAGRGLKRRHAVLLVDDEDDDRGGGGDGDATAPGRSAAVQVLGGAGAQAAADSLACAGPVGLPRQTAGLQHRASDEEEDVIEDCSQDEASPPGPQGRSAGGGGIGSGGWAGQDGGHLAGWGRRSLGEAGSRAGGGGAGGEAVRRLSLPMGPPQPLRLPGYQHPMHGRAGGSGLVAGATAAAGGLASGQQVGQARLQSQAPSGQALQQQQQHQNRPYQNVNHHQEQQQQQERQQGPREEAPWWTLLPDFVPAAALAGGYDPRPGPRPEPVFILYQKQFNGPANSAVAPMHRNGYYPPSAGAAGPSGGGAAGGFGFGGVYGGGGGGGGGGGPDNELMDWAQEVRGAKSSRSGVGRRSGRAAAAGGGGGVGAAAGAAGGDGGGGGRWYTNNQGLKVYVENGQEYKGRDAYKRYRRTSGAAEDAGGSRSRGRSRRKGGRSKGGKGAKGSRRGATKTAAALGATAGGGVKKKGRGSSKPTAAATGGWLGKGGKGAKGG